MNAKPDARRDISAGCFFARRDSIAIVTRISRKVENVSAERGTARARSIVIVASNLVEREIRKCDRKPIPDLWLNNRSYLS